MTRKNRIGKEIWNYRGMNLLHFALRLLVKTRIYSSLHSRLITHLDIISSLALMTDREQNEVLMCKLLFRKAYIHCSRHNVPLKNNFAKKVFLLAWCKSWQRREWSINIHCIYVLRENPETLPPWILFWYILTKVLLLAYHNG